MSIRVIASIGVVLCIAMTSFSIYLGVAEHIYTPLRTESILVGGSLGPQGRQMVCIQLQQNHNTTTTDASAPTAGPCHPRSTSHT